jgi:hypothetical protein
MESGNPGLNPPQFPTPKVKVSDFESPKENPKNIKGRLLGGSSHESQVAQKSGDILILGYPRIQVIQVG